MPNRIFIGLILLLLSAFIAIPSVIATPPQDIQLAYDSGTSILKVTITHVVDNPGDHFIKQVVIAVAGKEIRRNDYTSQPDAKEFTYSYPVTVGSGDEIAVTATCNRFGSLTRTISAGQQKSGITAAQGTGSVASSLTPQNTPGFEATAMILALIGSCVFIRKLQR